MAIIDPNERGAVVDYMTGPIVEENVDPLVDQVNPIINIKYSSNSFRKSGKS